MNLCLTWGRAYTRAMPLTENFTCPHCTKFSFFCCGDFTRPAASIWRNAVAGFDTANGHGAGVAVSVCLHCSKEFAFVVSPVAVGIYIQQCERWQRAFWHYEV